MAIIAAIVVTVGSSLFLAAAYFTVNGSEAALVGSVSRSAEAAAMSLAGPVWNLDKAQILRICDAVSIISEVVGVSVFEPGYVSIALVKDPGGPSHFKETGALPPIGPDEREVAPPILRHGQIVGLLTVRYDVASSRREAVLLAGYLALAAVALVVLLTAAIYLAVKYTAVKPIIALANEARRATATGDYSARLPAPSMDEVGSLYESYAALLDAVERGRADLAATKSILSDIIESMPSLLVAVDAEDRIILWNQAAFAVTGLSPKDMLGRPASEAASQLSSALAAGRAAMESRKGATLPRQPLFEGDPAKRDIYVFPLSEGSGYVIRADDVTELALLDRSLKEAQKLETIGTLAGGIAHDFNNLLAGIVGPVSLIKMDMEDDPSARLADSADLIDSIEASSRRAVESVKRLLTLSRRKEPDMAPSRLDGVVGQALALLESSMDKSIELDLSPLPDATIFGDASQLEQVFLNLFVNASHAMTIMRPAGEPYGGRLGFSVEPYAPDAAFLARHPGLSGPFWLARVSDTGVGIPEANLQRIFDPFFTTKDKDHGTGLGLSVAYSIIRQHKGTIEVSSEPGKTEFSVFLPASGLRADPNPKAPYDSGSRGEGRILIVDDEDTVRDVGKRILEKAGYEVALASGPEEGLEACEETVPGFDLVIMDLVMPKLSGLEAYRRLRARGLKVPVLVCSGFRDDERVRNMLAEGASGFLQKPFTMASMTRAVHECLDALRCYKIPSP